MNVLYDKDHYKLALGQVNVARHKVDESVLRLYVFILNVLLAYFKVLLCWSNLRSVCYDVIYMTIF